MIEMCVQEKKNLKKFPSEIENNYDKKKPKKRKFFSSS